MQRLTLRIILRTVFGVDGARMAELETALGRLTHTGTRIMLMPLLQRDWGPGSPQRRFEAARDEVDRLLYAEIRRRRESGERGEDVLSMLLDATGEDGSEPTEGELRDHLITLLIAGHETTATQLSWTLERLVRHPDAWTRLRSGDDAYLDAVIKETLRLRPVLPIVMRKLKAPMEIGGWALPEGVSATPCIYLMHRRPDIYPEPLRFRPERFLEKPAGTYTWIPFGGGVRRCLGASFALFEMAAVLRVLARRCERLEPDALVPERIARRSITLVPEREGSVLVG